MDQVDGVDNLTACDSVMLKGSFSHGRAYLSLNCCKKTKQKKKRMSGIIRTLSLLSIRDISSCACHCFSIHDNTV